MKKITYFGLFAFLIATTLSTAVYAIDFKTADAPLGNERSTIRSIDATLGNEKDTIRSMDERGITPLGRKSVVQPTK